MARFLIATAATPLRVAAALHDAYAIESTSDRVPRRDTGALVTVTRFRFSYPPMVVTGRAVPSVGGCNVHVKVRSGWLMRVIDLLALCAGVVNPAITILVLGASAVIAAIQFRSVRQLFASLGISVE